MAILLAIPLFIFFFGLMIVLIYFGEKACDDYDSKNARNENNDYSKANNEYVRSENRYTKSESKSNSFNHNSSNDYNAGKNFDLSVYYSELDLQTGCTLAEVKESYRVLVRVWHPDRYQHDNKLRAKAEEKMKKINEAYEVLSRY